MGKLVIIWIVSLLLCVMALEIIGGWAGKFLYIATMFAGAYAWHRVEKEISL